MPSLKQMLFVISVCVCVCSADPGAADGARLCVAPKGAAEEVFFRVERIGRDATFLTVGTPVKQCTIHSNNGVMTW